MKPFNDAVEAARKKAALFESFPRALLALRGKDRSRFLHNILTHDIKGLPPGQGRQACLLDRQGKIRFCCIVHADPEELVLEMDPSQLPAAKRELEHYLVSEEVQFQEVTDQYRIVPLHGPLAFNCLTRSWPQAELPASSLSKRPGPAGTGIRQILRWDLFRMPGFHLWVEPQRETQIRKTLLQRGEPLGLITAGPEIFEILRIEAGVPWPNVEMNETVIVNELDNEDLISYTKGCFVGQEIAARIKHRAHPPRLLKGFLLEGTVIPPRESAIRSQSEKVGLVTSACFSPTLNRAIALGFLKYGTETTEFRIETPSGDCTATLTELPIVAS